MSPYEQCTWSNTHGHGARHHDARGNTLSVQRDSGHLAASRSTRTCWAGEPWSARGSKPYCAGVDARQHVNLARYGKATDGEPRSEPDWGNPTVWDHRGACGNVDHGRTRNPPRLSQERVLETLCLKSCASQIYPDRLQHGRKTAPYTLTEDRTILRASGRCLAGNS